MKKVSLPFRSLPLKYIKNHMSNIRAYHYNHKFYDNNSNLFMYLFIYVLFIYLFIYLFIAAFITLCIVTNPITRPIITSTLLVFQVAALVS